MKCLDCNHLRVCQWCDKVDCNLGAFEGLSMSEKDKEEMLEASLDCTEFDPYTTPTERNNDENHH